MTGAGAALRTDGGLVTIRPACPDDRVALHALDAAASDSSIRFRYFSTSRSVADRYAETIGTEPQTPTRESFVAEVDGTLVGLAALEQLGDDSGELAVLIADAAQHDGIGTLLVEELIVAARHRRLATVCADVLVDNAAMLSVLRGLGMPMSRSFADGVEHVVIDLQGTSDLRARITDREQHAVTASLASVLAPRSIAVIGVGSRENSVGRAVLRNLIGSGYTGDLAVVHPQHDEILGLRAVHSIAELSEAPDLAVVAVPPAQVLPVIDQLGQRGARSVVLLTSGFGEVGDAGQAAQGDLLHTVRRHGMRLVGPNCLGIVNTDPDVRMNATFAPMPMLSGGLALASQSGAVGIAVARAAAQRGLGLAQLVSMGNKADVSGNDLLLAWRDDPDVRVIALYLESVGNARKFARIARSVASRKPVLALKAGRTAVGQRAGQSHTAAAAAAEPVVNALFAQAGVQRVDTMADLLDAAGVIDCQPAPRGRRVVIVGNSGGPEILASDMAEGAGLCVPELSEDLQQRLRGAAPTAASLRNPVDLGAGVQPAQISAVLRALLDSGEVDGVATVFADTLAASPGEVRAAVVAAAGTAEIPVVATDLGSARGSVPIPSTDRALPIFSFPESALRALATAATAAEVTRSEVTPLDVPGGVSLSAVGALIDKVLMNRPGWVDPSTAAAVLAACGIEVADQQSAHSKRGVLLAAERLGYPVVIKRSAGVHKSDDGGVFVDVRTRTETRDVMQRIGTSEVLVQASYRGVELIIGGLQDPRFGPVVMVGPGGVFADLTGGQQLAMTPLSAQSLDVLLGTTTMRKLLGGFRHLPEVSVTAVRDLIARVAWLIEHFPEVAELDLNPVICAGERLTCVDVKLRLDHPVASPDPASRLLNGPA